MTERFYVGQTDYIEQLNALNDLISEGGLTFTQPTAVLASDLNGDNVEVSPGDSGDAVGSILTAWGEDGVYPPVQEIRFQRPLIDADPPETTTFSTPTKWVRVRRALILSEEFFDDVSGNFTVPIRANCVRIRLSGNTVLYGGAISPAFPCRLIVMQPHSAAYSCRFSTPSEEGYNVRWIFPGNTWLDGVQSDAPVFTDKPGGVDIFELTDHFAIDSPVYVSHLFSSGVAQ